MRKELFVFCFFIYFIFFSFQACSQPTPAEKEPFDYSKSILALEKISQSDKLIQSIKRLHKIFEHRKNRNYKGSDTLFTILHIGDSHIQGDYFTSVIRKQLQYYFGSAGQGILFPYPLAQSYGPRGVEVTTKGKWKGIKTMSRNPAYDLGLSGYGAFINSTKGSLTVRFNEKFDADPPLQKETPVQKINLWHTAGEASFQTKLEDDFKLLDSKYFPSGWGVSTYLAKQKTNYFTLSPENTNGGQKYYGFYGFELVPIEQRGISYHHCGVVGAQFTHLITHAKHSIEQIKMLKPDLIIFSFGTNEAYNGNFDETYYTKEVKKFIMEIQYASPNTAIILTTAPDTRSQGKKPLSQINVNNALKNIAASTASSLYDLNAAMGGWGSMLTWHKKQLTLSDKCHFNTDGYAIQGKLMSLSFMEFYNKVNSSDTLDLTSLRNSVSLAMQLISKENVEQDKLNGDTLSLNVDSSSTNMEEKRTEKISKKNKTTKNKDKIASGKKKYHTVKKGDTLSKIARIYNVSSKAIARANGISLTKVLRLGQKLLIPIK